MAKTKATPKKEKTKSLDEYQQTKPDQLVLFEYFLPEERGRYSNTIELYDFIPKYVWGKVQRINDKFLDSIERGFECRGRHFTVKIKPARITDKDGVEREYFPSSREQLVEDALRKFVAEGRGVFLDDEVGVSFTLYQLQQELASHNHTYSLNELKDALYVCASTIMEIKADDGESTIVSGIFQTLGLPTREEWERVGQKKKAYVRFNPLVTASIKSRSFRQLNYELSMSFKNVTSRQLHRRLSHHYVQASPLKPYSIMLSTVIRDFGLKAYAQLRDNLRDVLTSLDELKQREVLEDYVVEKEFDATRRNRMIDAKLIMYPHKRFISETIQANSRQKAIQPAPPPPMLGKLR